MSTQHKRFQAIEEPLPAEQWLAYYHASMPAYRRWFASEGTSKRPDLTSCRAALQTYMPELVPFWENLLILTQANDDDARLLSFYCPAPHLSGCSQAVWSRYTPILIRNYDYAPEYCEGRIMKTRWHQQSVIATTDCLWGVLDGMNESGLSVSFTFGGSELVTDGFSIAIILRYILEFCTSVDDAVRVLCRVPAQMAYNVTVLDATGKFRTIELTPFSAPKITYKPMAVNHQGDFELSNYAVFSRSYERQQFIVGKLYDPLTNIESFTNAFGYSPLFSTNYTQGFGTLYTVIYNPYLRAMEYRWSNQQRMYQSFAFFESYEIWVELPS